jgi:hypothetical protein
MTTLRLLLLLLTLATLLRPRRRGSPSSRSPTPMPRCEPQSSTTSARCTGTKSATSSTPRTARPTPQSSRSCNVHSIPTTTRRWRRRHSASSGDAFKSPRPNRISPSGLFEDAALAHHRHRHCRHQRTTMPTRIAVRNQQHANRDRSPPPQPKRKTSLPWRLTSLDPSRQEPSGFRLSDQAH